MREYSAKITDSGNAHLQAFVSNYAGITYHLFMSPEYLEVCIENGNVIRPSIPTISHLPDQPSVQQHVLTR